MEEENNIPTYFIDEIEISPDLLTITLQKESPASFLNEMDKLPMVKIEIAKPDFTGSEDDLTRRIDYYDDGFVFEILDEEHETKEFITTDLGGQTFTIKGTVITRKDLPYSADQFWAAIQNYKQQLEKSNKLITELREKIETLKKYAEKEVNNSDTVLTTSSENENRSQRWTAKREAWLTVINLLK